MEFRSWFCFKTSEFLKKKISVLIYKNSQTWRIWSSLAISLWGYVCFRGRLLQVVVEVAGDAFVEVYALVAAHVVGLAWIYEEIGLGAGGDARFQE